MPIEGHTTISVIRIGKNGMIRQIDEYQTAFHGGSLISLGFASSFQHRFSRSLKVPLE